MRAGQAYVYLPIELIDYEGINDNVTELKESIASYGLLQPIGVARRGNRFKLIFGHRRLKACVELGHKYIHTVELTVREDEEKSFFAVENIHRRENTVKDLVDMALSTSGGDLGQMLCLSQKQLEKIRFFLMLSPEARKRTDRYSEGFLIEACGDSNYFLRMCKALEKIPEASREKVRLSLMSDKRIFINEIEKIVSLMKSGGFEDFVAEDEEKIVIIKKQGA